VVGMRVSRTWPARVKGLTYWEGNDEGGGLGYPLRAKSPAGYILVVPGCRMVGMMVLSIQALSFHVSTRRSRSSGQTGASATRHRSPGDSDSPQGASGLQVPHSPLAYAQVQGRAMEVQEPRSDGSHGLQDQ
jgi:hypothetical protein